MAIEWSIIIPTYKEKENLRELVTRVFQALAGEKKQGSTEVIIVDDNSRDGFVFLFGVGDRLEKKKEKRK